MTRTKGIFISLWLVLLQGACTSERLEPIEELGFDDFLGSKGDTSYYSNKAAEIAFELNARVYKNLSALSPEARANWVEAARSDPDWRFEQVVSQQLKYARNQLGLQKFKLNLERGRPKVGELAEEEQGVWATYSITVDSIVRFADLAAQGLTPADLVGRTIEVKLPKDPSVIFEQGGMACATDPDGDPLDPTHINSDNYFYYFDPFKEGCPLAESEALVDGRFELRSSADTQTVWPEFAQLIRSGKVKLVMLFGQIGHESELKGDDKGWQSYQGFIRNLSWKGFSETEQFSDKRGVRLETEYYGGLKVEVEVYSPKNLARSVERAERNKLFAYATQNFDIVHYDGHSSYGTLDALKQPGAFLPEKYQIIFMDGCESYSYYTKQVFQAKSGDADPTGMKFADVVNNVEPANTGSHSTAMELWLTLLQGADDALKGLDTSKYSWNNMVDFMNRHAEQRANWHGGKPELYGASGIRDNCYTPQGSRCP